MTRGNIPSWMACCVSENAPLMRACDAITVASVARATSAYVGMPSGTCAKKGFLIFAVVEMMSAP